MNLSFHLSLVVAKSFVTLWHFSYFFPSSFIIQYAAPVQKAFPVFVAIFVYALLTTTNRQREIESAHWLAP